MVSLSTLFFIASFLSAYFGYWITSLFLLVIMCIIAYNEMKNTPPCTFGEALRTGYLNGINIGYFTQHRNWDNRVRKHNDECWECWYNNL